MTAKFTPARDRLDLEQLEATLESPGYALIRRKIEGTVTQLEKRLRTCAPEELTAVQAEIRGLELALSLPDQAAKEIQAKWRTPRT